MKSPLQRMIAQRRLALVTERTPLQPGAVSEEPKPWGYVGCDFGVDGGSTAAYFVPAGVVSWGQQRKPVEDHPGQFIPTECIRRAVGAWSDMIRADSVFLSMPPKINRTLMEAVPARREMTATEVLFRSAAGRQAAMAFAEAYLSKRPPRPQWLTGEWT